MSDGSSHPDSSLAAELLSATGLNVAACYQCGKCSAGCPMAGEMPLKPHQMLRLAQLDEREKLLSDPSPWLCLTCETCTARCPNEVDPARLVDGLRELALARDPRQPPLRLRAFHKAFLHQIRTYGRVFEAGLILEYKLRTGALLDDVRTAPAVLRRGKLALSASKIEGRGEVRRIFDACREQAAGKGAPSREQAAPQDASPQRAGRRAVSERGACAAQPLTSAPSTKVGYFPGCSLHSTAKEFDLSLKAIAGPLGLELQEIRDWSCCGSSSAHATDHLASIALAARNLSLAEEQGLSKVMAPCAACFSRLAAARHEMARDERQAALVRPMLARPFRNAVEVQNVVALLRGLAGEIAARARPLAGLKVACYYGCLLVRPPDVAQFDDPEAPTSMEEVVAATGATAVRWSRRLDCCGAGFSLSRVGSVVRLGRAILEDAKASGAQAVVVACPMCHSNLDLRQSAMEARGASLGLPILFLTQLVGLALGMDGAALGLERHFVSAAGVLQALAAPAPPQAPQQGPAAAAAQRPPQQRPPAPGSERRPAPRG